MTPPFGLEHEGEYDVVRAGPLLDALDVEPRVAVLLVRMGGYAVGVFEGERLVASKVGTRFVKGRHKKGGSSANRFRRRRGEQERELVDAAAAEAARVLEPVARAASSTWRSGATARRSRAVLASRADLGWLQPLGARALLRRPRAAPARARGAAVPALRGEGGRGAGLGRRGARPWRRRPSRVSWRSTSGWRVELLADGRADARRCRGRGRRAPLAGRRAPRRRRTTRTASRASCARMPRTSSSSETSPRAAATTRTAGSRRLGLARARGRAQPRERDPQRAGRPARAPRPRRPRSPRSCRGRPSVGRLDRIAGRERRRAAAAARRSARSACSARAAALGGRAEAAVALALGARRGSRRARRARARAAARRGSPRAAPRARRAPRRGRARPAAARASRSGAADGAHALDLGLELRLALAARAPRARAASARSALGRVALVGGAPLGRLRLGEQLRGAQPLGRDARARVVDDVRVEPEPLGDLERVRRARPAERDPVERRVRLRVEAGRRVRDAVASRSPTPSARGSASSRRVSRACRASRARSACASAEPSTGSVPAASSSSSTSERSRGRVEDRDDVARGAPEKVERLISIDCSSPTSASTWSKTGSAASSPAGAGPPGGAARRGRASSARRSCRRCSGR